MLQGIRHFLEDAIKLAQVVSIHQSVVALDVQRHQRPLPFFDILAEDDPGIAVGGDGCRLDALRKSHPRHTGCEYQPGFVFIRIDEAGMF